MNSFMFSLLMGAPDGGASGAGGIVSFIPLIMVFAIFYFLVIRPQSKRQKETQKMLSTLKKGDKVTTIGGIHGVIQSVDETTVVVKVDDYAKIKFSRSAISAVDASAKEEKGEKSEKDEEKDKVSLSKDEKTEKEGEKKRFSFPFSKTNNPEEEKK